VVPAVVALQSAALGLRLTVVAVRWTNVVAPSRSPSGLVVVETADNCSQGIAVASTVTPSTRWVMTVLPSLACQVGLAKWVAMSLPFRRTGRARCHEP
jgi:hypothetical protein